MKLLINIKDLITFTKSVKNWAAQVAIGYTRGQTSDHAGNKELSLEAQEKFLMNYGDSLNTRAMYVFSDLDTARVAGRKEFDQLLEFYRKYTDLDNCPILIVEKMERLTRNGSDISAIKELVEEKGLIVHYVTEGHIQSDPFARLIRSFVATFYSAYLAEETSKGMKAKAEAGLYPSQAPIGFLNVLGTNRKKIIFPDPVRAPLIRKIFEWYVHDHKKTREILHLAQTAGLTCPRTKKPISQKTIRNILHYIIYTGFFDWKGVRYKGSHIAIIPLELFNSAQALLACRSQRKAYAKK